MNVRFECPTCNSSQILVDAFVSWDPINQDWGVHDVYNESPVTCNECGKAHHYDEARIEEAA